MADGSDSSWTGDGDDSGGLGLGGGTARGRRGGR